MKHFVVLFPITELVAHIPDVRERRAGARPQPCHDSYGEIPGKGASAEDVDPSIHSVGNPPKSDFPLERMWPPLEKPRDFHGGEDDHDDDNCFHLCVRLEFSTFDSKEDPVPWLNCCKTFF